MASEMECACADCSCKVEAGKAIMKDDKAYCCEACANGHKDHAGCDHSGHHR